jgi:hypothetical protein
MEAYNVDNYINSYLVGMDYPADSREVAQAARANRAPAEFIALLDGLPNYVFYSDQDLYSFVIRQAQFTYL